MKVAILGAGVMGKGIAIACASSGLETVLVRASQSRTDEVKKAIGEMLDKSVNKGKLLDQEKENILSKITTTASWEDTEGCDIVVESIVENEEIKVKAFQTLEMIMDGKGILASNTSTLSLTDMASRLRHSESFIGLHFFNPPTVMKLVEVIPTLRTNQETIDKALKFVRALKKEPIIVQDSTGFVVNRLLVPYLIDAIRVWESRTASIRDIDSAMQWGCNFPMGPFALMDYIGLDIVLAMANNLYEEFKEPHLAPPPVLKRLVRAGELGRKTKRGFYDYAQKPPKSNEKLEASRVQ